MKKVVLTLALLVSAGAYAMDMTVQDQKGMLRSMVEYPVVETWHGAQFVCGKALGAGLGVYNNTTKFVKKTWQEGLAATAMKLGVAPLAILAAIGVMTDPTDKAKSE